MAKSALQNKEYHSDVSFKGFVSENKFRNKRIIQETAELEDEIQKLEEEFYGKRDENLEDNSPAVEPSEKELPVTTPEEETWKKRYGDLRRYNTEQVQKLKDEVSKHIAEIENLKKAPVKYPTTEEELEEWMKKYPDVANIIRTIALKENEALRQELLKVTEDSKLQRLNADRQKAFNALLELQPDFVEISSDPKFAEYNEDNLLIGGWLSEQPTYIQEALFKPSFDEKGVKAASRIIDLYKNEMGLGKKSKTPETPDVKRQSASSVKGGNPQPPATNNDAPRFTESQIQRMSDKEYAKYEKQIEEAIEKGPPYFVYDLSGAR